MKIAIDREACCAADDQAGPLTMQLEVAGSCTVRSLAAQIQQSRFLQYSSTHSKLYAEAAGRTLLSISSESHGDGQIVYFVNHDETVNEAVPNGRLRFAFR